MLVKNIKDTHMPVSPRRSSLSRFFGNDANISTLYPAAISQLDTVHWSPLEVIHIAAHFLVQNETVNILDIGSGSGKFCLAAGYAHPTAHFYGVEQRAALVNEATNVCGRLGFTNVHFMHRNFTQLDFRQFDHFYFFNSFFENLDGTEKIDDTICYSQNLYHYYSYYLFKELEQMPAGTRIVTYCSWEDEIPGCYQVKASYMDALLKCWEKQ
jgi:SAM-dependent methyltransferase